MSSNWLNRIQQHAATPPEGAWQHIAGCLDNEQNLPMGFAAKLAAMEVTPPETAQKNIFATLDAGENHTGYEQRLFTYEEMAPAAVWTQIASELNATESRVIPLNPVKKSSFTVYMRAAAVLTLIAVLSITAWLFNRQSEVITATATLVPQQQNAASVSAAATASEKTGSQLKSSVTAHEIKTKHSTADGVQTERLAPGPGYIQSNGADILAQNPANGKIDKLQTISGETPQDISLMNSPPNSYITITGPDGQPVNISSKFSSLIGYLTEKNPDAQENLDIIIKESAQWRATFARWRDKMINNAVAPSLSNFMDIIELSKVLEEK